MSEMRNTLGSEGFPWGNNVLPNTFVLLSHYVDNPPIRVQNSTQLECNEPGKGVQWLNSPAEILSIR